LKRSKKPAARPGVTQRNCAAGSREPAACRQPPGSRGPAACPGRAACARAARRLSAALASRSLCGMLLLLLKVLTQKNDGSGGLTSLTTRHAGIYLVTCAH
jgi:hypothetical protein